MGSNSIVLDINQLLHINTNCGEEFKSKVSTIFEARVEDRVTQIEEEIETHYAGMLEEAVQTIKDDLTEKVKNGGFMDWFWEGGENCVVAKEHMDQYYWDHVSATCKR